MKRKQQQGFQRGGAVVRPRPTLTRKIAEALSMVFAGPRKAGGKLASKAFKGIKDNLEYALSRNSRNKDCSNPFRNNNGW